MEAAKRRPDKHEGYIWFGKENEKNQLFMMTFAYRSIRYLFYSCPCQKNRVDFVFFLILELTTKATSAIWWPDFPHISPEAFPHFLPFGTRIRIEKKATFCR
jgi:hypothetical protein